MNDYLPMDALAILALLVALVVVVALWSAHPIQWLREEWRLAWRENWWPEMEQTEHVVNPALGSTRDSVAVAQTEARQYALCARMRASGDWLLDYPPQMPPKASKVRRIT